jgi:hypothetical protein
MDIRKELDEIIDEIWYNELDEFLSQEEILAAKKEAIELVGGYEELEKQLAVGVKNGYPIEVQFKIIRKLFKELKDAETNQESIDK